MATIALYKNQINQMPELLKDAKNSVKGLKTELTSLKKNCSKVNRSICNLDDVISSISASTQTQEEKVNSLENLNKEVKEFASDAAKVDDKVADTVNKNKDDFYDKYDYLKPDSEKSTLLEQIWDSVKDGCKKVGEWCKEHWKEIVTTLGIVIGAIIAIAAVVATGGGALVPLLASVLTAIGVAQGTAMTIATVTSLAVAAIAVISTIGSAGLNIADIWGDFDNPTFQAWKSALMWTSVISNGFYSIGIATQSIMGNTMPVRDAKYLNEEGLPDWEKWAPNNGRVPGTVRENQTLTKGTIFDRYGGTDGNYAAPAGIPFEQRGLPGKWKPSAYHKYKVLKPIDNVTISQVAEAFEMPGGGMQYELPSKIEKLLVDGFIKEVKWGRWMSWIK